MTGHGPRRPIVLDRGAARDLDRQATEIYGIAGLVLMENAARGLFREAIDLLGPAPADARRHVVIACGTGNNGGDGYALARLLDEAGIVVDVLALGPPRSGTDAATNEAICRHMRVPIHSAEASDTADRLDAADLVVDALFGTGLDRRPGGAAANLVESINARARRILAVDLPSGLDCHSGLPVDGGPCIRATRTVTFAALKTGLARPESRPFAGHVVVAPLGIPAELLRRVAGGR